MSIQAKVSPLAQSVTSAAPIAIPNNGILTLTQSSNVVLDIAPESVTGYTKSGADLIVQLKSGESLRIANFYVEGQPASQLYLVDRDKLLAVDLPPVAADGPLVAGYVPQESLAGFESLTASDGTIAGLSPGGALLAGAAIIGGGVAIANSNGGGGGGGGGGGSVQPDTTAPAPASGLQIATDGSSISGTAEPGATVGIDSNGDGQTDISVVVGPDGNFQIPLNPPLTNGETVSVVVTDPAGNSSPPATVQAPDFPDAPQINPSNGSSLSGTAEPGSTVVLTDGNGNPIGQTTADGNGNWSYTPDSQLPDGTVINAVVEDAAGNSSPPASTIIDGIAPPAPVINPSNGTEFSGTAEPGSSVTLTDGSGNPIGQATADGNGDWSYTPATPLPDGTVVNATATDPAGNTSGQGSTTVDGVAPGAPTINVSDGSSLSGTAEPGSTVVLTDGNGNPIGHTTADSNGNWSYPTDSQLPDGTVVNAVVEDAAGNSSQPASTIIDGVAPSAPAINPSNGTELSGTAEPNSTVTLTDGSGNPIGQVTADGSGNWTYTPTTPIADGTVINVVAQDAAGNSSAPSSTTVDSQAPAAPAVNPSNGTTISGTAEPGSTVTLTDGSGNPIGQTTADGSGNWSFTPGTPLANSTVVNVVAQDPAGNTGQQGSTTVDSLAPIAPVVNPSNGSEISGTAEPASTVTLTDGSGNPIGQTTADGSGNWSFTPGTPLANGTVVNATATDPTGNTGPQASTTVDAVAPAAPVVEPSNGSEISGTAEPGSTVTLTDGSGNPIGQTTADGSGNWSFTPGTPLANSTVVNVVAQDPAGNTGQQGSTTVDSLAPIAPVVNPSNGSEISGTAEPASTVTLTDGSGNPIGQTTADGSGNWSFTPGTPLANGTVVNATATDPTGNTGPQASTTVDAVAPAAPVVEPSNGSEISGTAEPGSTVTLTDGSGNPIGQTTADGSGNWSFTPGTPLANGTVVNATATDPTGNTGPQASTTVDAVAPAAPVVEPSNGTEISGTAEAGATVILTDGGGNPIGQTTADGSGNWAFTPVTPLVNGTVINAVAQDPAGNTSGPTSVTVDAIAPAAPIITLSDGSSLSGTAEPNSTVTLTDGSGNPIGQATADGSGNWTFTPATPLADGTVVNVVAQDAAGNTSIPSSTTVDSQAPAVPVINPGNGTTISGISEPGSTVTLTDGSGNPIGQTTADGSGNWSFTPATPLADGTVVNATASDLAGNTGPAATVTVDSSAPAAPVINPSNGVTISGTAEVGATVTLTDGSGNPIGQTTADGSGNWSFTPGTPLANGTVVNATATDPTGNTGPQASTTVDAVAPAAPVVEPSNGMEISGTAEAGATVILTDGGGNPIGQTTADGSGNWAFTPVTPLVNGTVVNAVAQDPAGNTGPQGSTTVDSVAPAAPVVNPSNGAVLNGTAEPNSTVALTDGSGSPIGEVTTDGSGNWTYTPTTPLPDGAVVNATATDAASNTSNPGSTTVDSALPSIPQVEPSNGSVISGTADAGNTIILTDGNGNPIGQVTADGSGNWSFTPGIPLPDGTVVNAVARNPGGTESAPAVITVDGVAPAAPVVEPSNGTEISGTAEAGATVILTDGGGNPIGQTTADGSGNWSFTPATPLADGTVVNATASDLAGNTGPAATVTVDSSAPAAPVINPSNGVTISGTAEAGATVTLTDGSGNPIGQTTADGSGNWSFTPGTPLANGTVVNATATDPTGNTGPQASTTVDAVAPAAPVVEPSNGSEISGTAEPGSTVTLTDGSGNPIGQTTADGSGNWSFTPATPLADGTVVNAVAQDPAGNTGPQGSTTVDSVAPAAPVVEPSNGTEISGTAEAGATVILTDGGGNPIGQTTADGSGNWSFTPATPLANGTVVNAVAQDPAGNTGPQGSTTVDSVAPAAPVVNPSNGAVLNGTAEPNSTVALTDGSGNPIGEVTTDGSGNWTYTPTTPLPDGAVVNATATDAAGNTSNPGSTTVDSSLPSIPQVEPSNGSVISGTADAGNTIILTDGNGNPIGQVTADGSGNWSFTPGIPLPDGTVVNAVARNPGGTESAPAVITVDGVAPAAPVVEPSNGTEISGTAEAGATVILTDGGGNPIGQTTADGSGNWSFTPATPLANGTVVNATATDPAGNTSGQGSTTVDAIAPAAPIITLSDGSSLSGTAEPNSTVTLTDGSGNPIGEVTTDGSGNWSFTPATPLADGTVVNATATDAAGNTSNPGSTTVDSSLPSIPQVEPSNGSVISGTADAGNTIILTDGNGNPIGQVTADGSGNWSFTPGIPLPDGTVVNAVARNPGGTESAPAVITVDGVAPTAPVVEPSNGTEISGTAEAGATVILTDGGGNPIGQTTADGSGNWSFTPATPLADGTVVNATASDLAGNTGPAATVTVDSSAPAAPVINPSNGVTISGTAEAGATVTLTDGSGNPIGQTTADGSGNWSFTPGTPLANGTVVNATATDPTGNTGPQATTTVDSVAPAAPVIEPSNGSEISGTAEPGSTVTLTDGSGNPIGQTTADSNGDWSFTPATPLADGTVVNAVAQDPAGNTGPQGSTTVDSLAPVAPVVNPSNGTVINGTAEPNSTVTLTDGSGNPIGEATADGSGNWSFTPATPLANGTEVNATASDPAGNTGPAATVTVDSSAPAAPVINPSNGVTISGTAEVGATVTLTDGSGNPIGQITADGSGNWSFTPGTPLANGTVVNATATDPTGNTGPQATTTVDSVAPVAPVVELSNGVTISGTAEAGATVTLTDGSGNPIGQTTADGSGNWSFTPGTPLANGTVVNATATDPTGNTGPQASTTVDAVAPAAPVVEPSNGSEISGTAEPGSTVILTDGSGNPIGQTTADGNGDWSFTPATPLADGTVVNAVAQDPAGNTGPQGSTTVDSLAPAAPVVNPSNGTVINGTAEPNSTVTLTDGSGNPIGQATADGSGNWTYIPATPLADGTVVNATASDPAGNTGPAATVTVDSSAPAAPVINPSNGVTISGTAEAGATVTLTDGSGNPIGQITADGSGNWSFTPGTPLANGTVVNATATDPTGNASAPSSTTVDSVVPVAPVVEPSNGSEISGTAEPGSTITLTDGSGNPIGQTTADGNGDWSFTPATPLADGTVINATATDPAGNTGGQGSTTVDGVAPGAPTVNLSDGSSLSGTAEPNSTVTLTDGSGNPIGQATADGSGNWSFTPGSPLPNGTVVNATASDPAGNTGPAATVTVDSSAPAAPVINPSNGVTISGTAEAGATVTLTDGSGSSIGQITADGSGNWSFTPGSPLPNGTVVNATATDPTGNASAPSSTTVDSLAPAAPVIEPSNGSEISGTAEPGSTVTLTDGSGNPIGQTTADGSGNWSFTPATPLANGTVVNAVAQDPAGNTGPQGSTTVDSVAPAAPVVNPSNGAVLNGTAEPNSTVALTDGSGNPIGEVTTDGSGNWTFTPGTPLPDGTAVNATATDAAGNTSNPGSTTVDSSLPSIPQVEPSNGSVISGTADAGNTIILTDGNGNPIGQVTADGSGNWSFTPGIPLPDGTVVNAVARNSGGTESAPAVITVDGVAPAAPVVEPSNGTEISGTAEAGATVILTDGGGNPIGQTTADGSGNWAFTPVTPLVNGTVINAVAQDPAGNTSGPTSVTVDAIAPAAPIINLSDGSSLSGTAEPNSTVTLTDGSGNPIGEVTTDGSGNWSFTPATPLADGTVVTATASDLAGNTGPAATVTVDSSAPAAPVINPSNGVTISGTAEAGATVTLTDGSGNPIGQTTADGSGNWSFTPGTPLANGTVVNATATDLTGNTGPQATTTVDAVAPAAPVVEPSNGTEISGTAEAGATVILTDGGGNPIGQTTADGSGNWAFTPVTPLVNGTVINAVAQDPAGNTSGPTSVTVDAIAPAAPIINLSDGSSLSGTAEPNSTVTLTDGSGNPIGEVTTDGSGNWSFTPATPLADGTVVTATASDLAGNTGPAATVTVDSSAPAAPVINPSNGVTISGTAEAGATVTLTDGSGNPIGQITADGSGNWSFTPGTPLANGTVVNATATDLTGNTGPQATTTVDAVAPAAPVVEPSNGTEISGTAEAGATVILTDGGGNPIGQTTADGSGNWAFTPVTPLVNGTVINAVAQDPAGNTSGPTSVTVDAIAPAAPIINLSDGSSLSGTAEPNSTVTLTDGSGNPIGEVTTDGSGNWSFTPATPLADGTEVNATASDLAGNTGPAATVTVDSSAPAAPVINPSNGVTISGTAEAGATVTLTDGSGNPIGQITADGSGNWSFTPGTPLANGTVVNATATDPTGNTGPQATTTVDSVAPAAPVIEPSNGSEISGTAEPGSTVTLTDGSGNPIGQTTADGNGDWSFTPATPLADGTVVNATATDPAGNTSGQGSTTVDAVAPGAPTVNLSDGSSLSGTAEPNSTVTLTDGSGNPIGEATADGSGNWSFTPATPLANGTEVNATASDPAGNTGPAATVTVDSSAPAAPVINPSNGVTISGTAEAGATVTLTDGSGNPIGQITADGSGNWTFTPGTPLANGTVVNATATDPTGNTGPQATTTVDSLAPAAPVVEPSNGSEISGTAEPGSTVTLTDGSGNPIGQTTADGNGDWSFTPATPLADGTVVNAVAQDPAGNTSGPTSVTVDAIAPPAPVINPSNGVVISGTAEAGAKVILTDGSGSPIGDTTADGSGNWAFTPATPLANGTVINAVAQDPAGNTSAPATSTTVDTVAPGQPTIDPSNGVLISGTAEAEAKVILTDGSGNPIGETTTDGSGNWAFTPGTPLANGTVINAVAQDAVGNTSSPVISTTVDAVAPGQPTIAPSNGTEISGTAEAGATVILTDGSGNPIGQATADGSGNWAFTPATPLGNGTVINAVAQDPAGNTSGPTSVTVDAIAPSAPVINPSNGVVISGTAEAGAKVILTDGSGNPIGETIADGSGDWSFTPATPLANGTVINAVAEDAAGNASGPASTTVDSVPPSAPLLSISADGALLTGTAEPNSQVRIVIDGDTANPITVNVDGSGNFSLPFAPPLITGELIAGVAVDAAGNLSGPATINAPDLAPPTISVPEAADSWINAAEISDGIQVDVAIRPTMQVGQVITVAFAGQNGYETQATHTITAGDILAGSVTVTIPPGDGMGPFPEGASTVTADINGGSASNLVPFTVDTVPPATPVLSLVGSILTISTDPGTELTVTVDVGGVTATATVTADNSGLASLNLLTDLDIDLTLDQLLNAQVSVTGQDPAGNQSNVATIGVGSSIEQPVTIGNFGVDVSLNPLNPRFGFSGTTEPDSSVVIRVITPALNVELLPIQADSSGNFSLNLLSPTVLTQLGLNITDILNLGSQISFNLVATDTNGNDSAAYGITLTPNGLSLNIGQIDVNGTAGDDVMSGANGSSEHINGGDGSDLIFNVGTGDQVVAGDGNDAIQITATDFTSIDGGAGFDTLILADGIDLDYNAVGVGTLSNIERIDLGRGDSGSVLTLTAAEVDAITDGNNILQITGENNDTLNVVGAVNTGTTQQVNGITYDVYNFGSSTLLIEDNTVQVVV